MIVTCQLFAFDRQIPPDKCPRNTTSGVPNVRYNIMLVFATHIQHYALHWILSMASESLFSFGNHIQLEYSRCGLIMALYNCIVDVLKRVSKALAV